MNIPAYTSPTLCIGRTFDAENSTASIDIFPSGIPTKQINVNKFSFKYSVVKNSKDVNDLLDVSGELSLKIKANLLKVEGAGQYVNEAKKEEGTTTLLAVMKCTTVTETIDGQVEPVDSTVGIGTHYVRSVTYGAELVAKLNFRTSTTDKKEDIKGGAEGELSLQAVNVGLKAELQKLTRKCESVSDLQVDYYSTGLPDKLPTTIEGLTDLIEAFPSRMKDINDGKGIPMTFELLPVTNIIPTARAYLQDRVKAFDMEEMENCFDDVRNALDLANEYLKSTNEEHVDVKTFISKTRKVEKVFRKAISTLGRSEEKEQVEKSQDAYEEALDGLYLEGKFVQHWKKISSTKKPTTNIKLPEGRSLSLVLLGKTGNGKSKTGNNIIGKTHFKASSVAASVTKVCLLGRRKDERAIDLIDTPGVLDTTAVSLMAQAKNMLAYFIKNNEVQNQILREVARIFAMAPDGFDCFILVAKYGCRFTAEDAQALKMLQKFLGRDACDNIIIVLTYGDQLEREAEENEESVEVTLEKWLESLPEWIRDFIALIKHRVVPFNNCYRPDKEPEEYKKQLSRFIKLIDEMTAGRGRFIHPLTNTSKGVLEQQIKEALDQSGVNEQLKSLQKKQDELMKEREKMKQLEEENARKAKKEREEMERKRKQLENDRIKQQEYEKEMARKEKELEHQRKREEEKRKKLQEEAKKMDEERKNLENKGKELELEAIRLQKETGGYAVDDVYDEMLSSGGGGGCYPGSATVVDILGRPRRMDSLRVQDKVQVMTSEGIRDNPVITFIHRQPEVLQEFLRIATLKKSKILVTTGNHLLFVEKEGRACAIPAREVSIGDTVYVRGHQGTVETDVVQSISSVTEKGVYAPVTLNGTILVNDVHTSCYFDVLSHEWSHRAMGVVRAVYHVSPLMGEWISGVGKKDGFPGWCRLARKIHTFMN